MKSRKTRSIHHFSSSNTEKIKIPRPPRTPSRPPRSSQEAQFGRSLFLLSNISSNKWCAAPRGRTSNSKGSHQQLQEVSKVVSMASKGSCDPIDPTVDPPLNTEMMLKMGKLGLRCVVKVPKNRPTMSMVWQELEEALYYADNFISKHPSRGSRRSTGTSRRPSDIGLRRSMDYDQSQNSVSIDGIGLQRFHVDIDSISLWSTSLRCLELDDSSSIINIENLEDIHEESIREKALNM